MRPSQPFRAARAGMRARRFRINQQASMPFNCFYRKENYVYHSCRARCLRRPGSVQQPTIFLLRREASIPVNASGGVSNEEPVSAGTCFNPDRPRTTITCIRKVSPCTFPPRERLYRAWVRISPPYRCLAAKPAPDAGRAGSTARRRLSRRHPSAPHPRALRTGRRSW